MSRPILLQEEAILEGRQIFEEYEKNRKGLVFVFWNLLKEFTMN